MKASTETISILQPYCEVKRACIIYSLFPRPKSRTSLGGGGDKNKERCIQHKKFGGFHEDL
jgi:hypothetical protein